MVITYPHPKLSKKQVERRASLTHSAPNITIDGWTLITVNNLAWTARRGGLDEIVRPVTLLLITLGNWKLFQQQNILFLAPRDAKEAMCVTYSLTHWNRSVYWKTLLMWSCKYVDKENGVFLWSPASPTSSSGLLMLQNHLPAKGDTLFDWEFQSKTVYADKFDLYKD